ncbi:MAG: hypothetical protein GY835_11565 [bacterium]|nr:hypothetical protein [bacterium]
MVKIDPGFLGRWRITETTIWDQETLDLVEPASLSIEPDGTGNLNFIAVDGTADYRSRQVDGAPLLEFSWQGWDEGDQSCGRGWAVLKQSELRGRIFIHYGEDSAFVARRFDGRST